VNGFHAARRACEAAGAYPDATGRPLELQRDASAEPPRLVPAEALESDVLRVRAAGPADGALVSAFLDGRQESRVVAHAGLVPIVWGHVGAVVRQRSDRRLVTWPGGLRMRAGLWAPRPAIPPGLWSALQAAQPLTDLADGEAIGDVHPFAWHDRAYHAVQEAREDLERSLADAWVAAPAGVLYVDGGLPKAERVARSLDVLGVVKTHRSLYVPSDALGLLAGLAVGERTTAVRVTSARRTAVASWYARRHDARGRDPLFGLVRLEAALPDGEPPAAFTARADRLTRMVLAEAAPLALPDPRWPVMAYGIRDCEEVLRAVMG
jgi:hypothetical protein